MNRLNKKILELKRKKRKALVAFITAAYPDLRTTAELIDLFEKNGVDIVEIGVPFSDPIADGPVIQYSSEQALRKGIDLGKILSFVKTLRKKTQIPILLMSYLNPIYKMGLKDAAKRAAEAGVDGFIIPDIIPEESAGVRKIFRSQGLPLVYFVAPNTPLVRMEHIDEKSRGFVYVLSLTGVTGKRKGLAPHLKEFLDRTKKHIQRNLRLVGFGISSKEQAAELKGHSDGIIVGSAIIELIRKNRSTSARKRKIAIFIRSLRKALDD
jgi:tryptophan synthase alpha chain